MRVGFLPPIDYNVVLTTVPEYSPEILEETQFVIDANKTMNTTGEQKIGILAIAAAIIGALSL